MKTSPPPLASVQNQSQTYYFWPHIAIVNNIYKKEEELNGTRGSTALSDVLCFAL